MRTVLDLPYGESLLIDPDNGEPKIGGRRGGATHPAELRGTPDGERIHDLLVGEEKRRRQAGEQHSREFWAIVRAKLYLEWQPEKQRFMEGAVT